MAIVFQLVMKNSLFLFAILLIFSGCSPLYIPSQEQADIAMFEPNKPIEIALVLGGGGARGLAHLGAIKELEAAGIRPDVIIGCSAGAILGAFYADDPYLNGVEQILLNLKRSDLLDVSFFKSQFGLIEGKALEKFLEKKLHSKTFDQLKIPLIVVATDLITGETIELSQGNISKAVGASSAYPGVFKPIFLHNRFLVDGGVSSPVPVEIAKKYGAKVIIAIDVSQKLVESKPCHFFGVAKRGMEIAYIKFVEQSLSGADIVIKMDFEEIGMFSDAHNQRIYETGCSKVQAMLPEIKKKLSEKNFLLASERILE